MIKLLTHKPTASFRNSTKIGQKHGIKFNEKLYNVKCAITDILDVYLFLLTISTFNRNVKSTVLKLALTEFFLSILSE